MGRAAILVRVSTFNPTVVRLGLRGGIHRRRTYLPFNPTVVRLGPRPPLRQAQEGQLPFNPTVVRLGP